MKKSKFDNLGESSVEALKRVEAECDWSDAALLFSQPALKSHQPKEPPASGG